MVTPKILKAARQSFRDAFKSSRGMILALILCGLIAHIVVLNGSFKTMDDEFSIVNNENLRSLSSLGTIFTECFFGGDAYYRPLVTLSFLFDYQIAGLNPLFYYLSNVVVHLANGILLFLIFNILLKKKSLSFITALLFIIHPIQWEAVANIAGRSILLCAFWQFVSFWLYLKFALQSRLNPHRKFYFAGSLLAFVLALLSKESAVVTPFLLAGYEYWLRRRAKGKILSVQSLVRLAPFVGILGGYFLLRKLLGITSVSFWPSLELLALGVLTFLSSMLIYLRVFIFPIDLYFDRATMYYTNFADWGLWLTLAAIVIFSWVTGRYHARWSRRIKFMLFWFVVSLLPVSQLVPLPAHIGYAATADHFYYVPSAGLLAFFVLMGYGLIQRGWRNKSISRRFPVGLVGGVAVYFMLITIGQNLHAVYELSMFEKSLSYNPANTRVRISYGLALAKVGLFAEAEQQFREVLFAEPWDARARIGFAKSLCDQGKCLDAIFEYETITDAGNMQELLEQNLKYTYDVVIGQYQNRLKEDPENAQLYYSLGVVYAKSGREREAARAYHQALRFEPHSRFALYNLGALLESGVESQKAAGYFKKVITLARRPDQLSEYSYRHLAKIYEHRRQWRRAQAYFQAAEKIAGQK